MPVSGKVDEVVEEGAGVGRVESVRLVGRAAVAVAGDGDRDDRRC